MIDDRGLASLALTTHEPWRTPPSTPRTVSGIAAATALLLAAFGRRCLAGPLARLAEAASALAERDVGVTVDGRRNDEIGDGPGVRRDENCRPVSRRTAHKEIDLAQRIRTSLLPGDVAIPALDVGALMASASEVGGDY